MNNKSKEVKNLVNFLPELILFLIFILISFSLYDYEKNLTNYIFTENLINYEGGFIRRGFLGSIALFFFSNI